MILLLLVILASAIAITAQSISTAPSTSSSASTLTASSTYNGTSANTTSILTGSYPTATLLIAGTASTGFAGEVVHMTSCMTTYGLTCTSSAQCGNFSATVTEGAFNYIIEFSTTKNGSRIYISDSCTLENVETALCSQYRSFSKSGQVRTLTITSTNSNVGYLQLPITAGANILTEGASSCSPTSSLANSPTVSTNSNRSQGGLSADAKTGIGVGVGLGVPLVLCAAGIALYLRRRRRYGEVSEPERAGHLGGSGTQSPPLMNEVESSFLHEELPTTHQEILEAEDNSKCLELSDDVKMTAELPGDGKRSELPTRRSMLAEVELLRESSRK